MKSDAEQEVVLRCPDGERCSHGCRKPACFRYPVGQPDAVPSVMPATVEVSGILKDGELLAAQTGTMWGIYRVLVNADTGTVELVWEGMATLTGGHNIFRWWNR